MIYRRTGRSGLMLPALSVGLWQRFGGDAPSDENRASSSVRSRSA
jgi:L-glyceraldehyde 3-phosphate reductase